jgi:hypothetical protein
MAWTAPTSAALLLRFTPQEAAGIKSLQGGTDTVSSFLSSAVAEVRDYIQAGGYPVDSDVTKLPLGLHETCYAMARWNLLISVPSMKISQTEERQKAFEAAVKKCERIANQQQAVEDPNPTTPPAQHTGGWNSENKILMRGHPTPRPSTQAGSSSSSDYANGDGPSDA